MEIITTHKNTDFDALAAVVVEMYQDIVNVDAAVGIFRDRKKEKCLVFGRSAVDVLNIGNIMRVLGGGGHTNAGSAMLKSINPDAVVVDNGKLIGLITRSDTMRYYYDLLPV